MPGIVSNLNSIRSRIVNAAETVGREPNEIKLIAVSKTHPVATIREAMTAGISVFGENKVQEAEGKIVVLGRDGIEWHLIGHLQSNKARKAVQLFDVIHSVDSLDIAKRLERICAEEGREKLEVLIQVDLAGEETKSGIPEAEIPELIVLLTTCERLKLIGLRILKERRQDHEAEKL